MTITNPSNRKVFVGPGNGFAYNFPVFAFSEIYVEILTDLKTIIIPVLNGTGTFDFTLAGTFDNASFRYINGVTVTLNTALPSNHTIVVENRVVPVQLTNYTAAGPLPSERFETDLDRLTLLMQAANTIYTDLIRIAASANIEIDPLIPEANKFLRWNAAADGIDNISIGNGSLLVSATQTEAEVGTNNTAYMTPLRSKEGINAQVFNGINVFSKTQKWAKGADIASAFAIIIPSDGNYFDVTGTVSISQMTQVGVGAFIKLHFDAALVLVHHATDLILPGRANITTAAGDEAEFVEYAAGQRRCTSYTKASGLPVVGGNPIPVVAKKTDTFTTASTTYEDVPGLSVVIIPSTAAKKVSIRAVIQASLADATGAMFFQLLRGATPIAIGDAASNRIRASASVRGAGDAPDGTVVIEWQDEPATGSAVTYKIQARVTAGTGAVNRGATDADDAAHGRYASFIRAVEED